MSALAGRPFLKMNGLGNEIVVLDLRGTEISVSAAEARAIHRGAGLAYDQLMVLHDPRSAGTDAFVRIYNNDGSESGACGNGSRCVAYLLLRDDPRDVVFIETIRGNLECRREGSLAFTVDMGEPRLGARDIPLAVDAADTRHVAIGSDDPALTHFSAVSMGNPHAIFFVDDVDAHDLARRGPLLEQDPIFPERANISLARVVERDRIVLKVWERGVGLTQACGSGACAALVAAARAGLTERRARVTLPGGDLTIDWRVSDDHVMMTGPVELEFEGAFDASLFEALA